MDEHSEARAVDATVTATVRGLAHSRRVTSASLAELCGIGTSQMTARLNGRASWKLREAVLLARYFQVSLDDLVSGNVSLAPPPKW
ncbi:helix-turn-helix domain-containing protein [Occultella kanbiaonis]|uniref:helix-turn-helix domain-containing protein n=1 Tax=Occultella kanbiaonis TaxID=2675754 RepID=UPI0012B85DB3